MLEGPLVATDAEGRTGEDIGDDPGPRVSRIGSSIALSAGSLVMAHGEPPKADEGGAGENPLVSDGDTVDGLVGVACEVLAVGAEDGAPCLTCGGDEAEGERGPAGMFWGVGIAAWEQGGGDTEEDGGSGEEFEGFEAAMVPDPFCEGGDGSSEALDHEAG